MSAPWSAGATCATPAATRACGAALARLVQAGDVVLLCGGLGAGKTTFAQGFAAGLGIAEPVTSPTFTLVRHYACPPGAPVATFLHADVWRLDTLGEVADLALGELVEDDAVALVEWGDVAAPVLGPDALAVTLAREPSAAGATDTGTEDEPRRVRVTGGGRRWAERRGALEAALGAVGGAP